MLVLSNILPLLLSHVPLPQIHTLSFLLGHELHRPTLSNFQVSHRETDWSLCRRSWKSGQRPSQRDFNQLPFQTLKKTTTFTACEWGNTGPSVKTPKGNDSSRYTKIQGSVEMNVLHCKVPRCALKVFLKADSLTNARAENCFCCATEVGKPSLTHLPLSAESRNFSIKRVSV